MPRKPERIKDKALAEMTGLPLKLLRELSGKGEIPTAASILGNGRYTYNSLVIQRWVRAERHERYRPKPPVKMGFVYVIEAGGFVKIGFATDVRNRLRSLQTAIPWPISTIATNKGSMLDERRLHARFQPQRASGEWFRREGDVSAWIDAGCPL